MGNTCKPMDVSFQCMTKSTTIKKKKKKCSLEVMEELEACLYILCLFASFVFYMP